MSAERFTLELRALAGEVPVTVRLRHLLKQALRQHGFRCMSCVEAGGRLLDKDGSALPVEDLAAGLAERSADLAALVVGASLPPDVADDLRRRLAGLAEELEEASAEVAEAGP